MSEIGYLSNQYERLAQTNQVLNEAVLLLKKSWLLTQPGTRRKYPNLSVNAEELNRAQAYILEVLKPMVYPAECGPTGRLIESKQLPPSAELKDIVTTIEQNGILQEKYFSTLNRLLDVLDGERSVLFRKLRTGK
ncbi:hypothetical protein J2I47_08035 [Fibrella sp. HMF5335]|uniref:Uncharacterized protein n=1 Tax=Fibrella rubiginis TaxID=2817060 RepID=A0A939K4A4_9BACT|nr:hypothetical protein [Fibrella rubiginis]MBO0936488.1 hypothetical protein [Fibrella rubiginis]